MSDTHKSWTEEIKVSGENLLQETERLIHEGNVSHLVVKNESGHTIVEFPVNIGIIGIILVPVLAAVAAIAVYAAHFTVIVTRVDPPFTPELVGEVGVVDVPLVVAPPVEPRPEVPAPPVVVPPAPPAEPMPGDPPPATPEA